MFKHISMKTMNGFLYSLNIIFLLLMLCFTIIIIAGSSDFPLQEGRNISKPVNCREVDDCEEPLAHFGQSQKICGTNGRTYKSFCSFTRAVCKEGNVQFKHFGDCTASDKCLGKRKSAMKDAKVKSGVYIPVCLPDGTYKPVQCHSGTGHCWCATATGQVQRDTVILNAIPNCNNFTKRYPKKASTIRPSVWSKGGCQGKKKITFIERILKTIVDEFLREHSPFAISEISLETTSLKWKFNELNTRNDEGLKRSEYRGMQKIIRRNFKPRKCAKKFPKMCDLNSDHLITQHEWMKCFAFLDTKKSRKNKFKSNKGGDPIKKIGIATGPKIKPRPCEYDRRQALETGNKNIFIPECNRRGKFKPVQCYGTNTTGSWYCFCVNTKTGKMIENTSVKYGSPNCTVLWGKCRPLKGEGRFLEALLRYFIKYMKEIVQKKQNNSVDIAEENIIEYLFDHFDADKNDLLDGRERKQLKKAIKKKRDRVVWICGRKIHKVCDINEDGFISRQELYHCVSPARSNKINEASKTEDQTRFNRTKGMNPFEEVITPE